MPNEKAGGYISRIKLNNGKSLEILQDDIVIFVGPNNSGKSQSLKDIYALSAENRPTLVISDISITKCDVPISDVLEKISIAENNGSFTSYNVLGQNINIMHHSNDAFF